MSNPTGDIRGPVSRPRGWVWFFVALAALTVVAITLNWQFNLSQQLRREQLNAARADWKRHGPVDYDLEFAKEGSVTGTYSVRVRKGKVVSATLDGRSLEPRLYPTCHMDALFDDIERFLEMDQQPGSPRAYNVAAFDVHDGHLLRYVRSVSSTGQRVDIRVNSLTPVAAGGTEPPSHPRPKSEE